MTARAALSVDAAWALAAGAELAVADDANLVSLAPPPVWTAETEPREFAGEIATILRRDASRDGKLSASSSRRPAHRAKVLRVLLQRGVRGATTRRRGSGRGRADYGEDDRDVGANRRSRARTACSSSSRLVPMDAAARDQRLLSRLAPCAAAAASR